MGYEISEIGELIRRFRKLKGLRLEDLADENISPATISNVERGVSHVRQDKMFYLLEKLGISIKEIPCGTMHRAKGLEFRVVFLVGCHRATDPALIPTAGEGPPAAKANRSRGTLSPLRRRHHGLG
ncbi:helix-turn-helix domain-containing protein [Kroppenstedtia sanguinis]|uniref:Helix-turn-helix domain-containing protein n=1 Tax=Kroppenstedtia sanguinis TaxID=1380684 RepID=A0ABW4CE58_9BACL